MRGEIISDRTYNHAQSWFREIVAVDYDGTDAANGRTNLRYTVRYNAYRFQSSGVVERWSGASWETVHRIAGEQLEGYDRVGYVSKTCSPAVFDDDLLELDRVAGMVLGLD